MNADINNPTNRTLAVIDGGLTIDAGVRPTATSPKPKLLNQVREASGRGITATGRRRLMFTGSSGLFFFTTKRHPADMAEAEIGRFLSSLATDGHVSASTQNQALNALLFLYKELLDKKIGLV